MRPWQSPVRKPNTTLIQQDLALIRHTMWNYVGPCPFRSQNRAGSANPQRVEGREGCVGRLSFARSLRSNDKSIEDSNIFLKCSSFSLPLHIPLSLDGMAILSLTVLPALPVKLSRRHCSLPSFEGAFLTRHRSPRSSWEPLSRASLAFSVESHNPLSSKHLVRKSHGFPD